MPTNKNAVIRYKVLDEMLSDRCHFYDINDLTEGCNDKLLEFQMSVSRRCIEKDIKALEDNPFYADIERGSYHGKHYIKYADSTFSVFKEKLSKEEKNLIHELLNTIGLFEGLENFNWLDKFKQGLGLEIKKQTTIISFSNNPCLVNSNLLGTLFDKISNQVVIEIRYHKFLHSEIKSIVLHPYLLKQYNDRWYIVGASSTDNKILHFALDRIEEVIPKPEIKFVPCRENLTERFKDIVGVTLLDSEQMEHIVFWVGDASKDYVVTKPIHNSQTMVKDEEAELRNKYQGLDKGAFFTIDCIPNYELIRELCSFGKELLVLEPKSIRDKICIRISEMNEQYCKLRT